MTTGVGHVFWNISCGLISFGIGVDGYVDTALGLAVVCAIVLNLLSLGEDLSEKLRSKSLWLAQQACRRRPFLFSGWGAYPQLNKAVGVNPTSARAVPKLTHLRQFLAGKSAYGII